MLERIEHGAILELRLARPPANALSPGMIGALREALEELGDDVRGLVLSGREGMFSGGLDVPEFMKIDRSAVRQAWVDFFAVMQILAESPRPTACAITGHAPAGGCVLALFCDWRVMAEGEFRIGLNEVQVGLGVPDPIHAATAHVVGSRQAERMCATAQLFGTEEALRIGLVDELCPIEEVIPRALAWIEVLVELPQQALNRTRALTRRSLAEPFKRLDEETLERFVDEWFGDETQGAMQVLVDRLAQKSG
jgi:enoyl-CoA hydratase/carnithine racemase